MWVSSFGEKNHAHFIIGMHGRRGRYSVLQRKGGAGSSPHMGGARDISAYYLRTCHHQPYIPVHCELTNFQSRTVCPKTLSVLSRFISVDRRERRRYFGQCRDKKTDMVSLFSKHAPIASQPNTTSGQARQIRDPAPLAPECDRFHTSCLCVRVQLQLPARVRV